MKKLPLILTIVVLCCTTTLVQAVDYLPVDPSNPNSDHWYVSTTSPNISWHRYGGEPEFGFGTHHMVNIVSGEEVAHIVHLITVDENGSVGVTGMSQDGGENYLMLDPAFPLVQAPLYVGLVWNFELEGFISAEFECLAEEDIEACGVTYPTFEIRALETYPNGFVWEGHQWYSDGFGIVKFDWQGQGEFVLECTVGTEQESWSGVKALYR